ncbi:MAG: hypothetical protein KDD53_04145, partial [Bdellovibrionales bacterium]|nr:hypothetical protein [Bdellovibrionales bacterium]
WDLSATFKEKRGIGLQVLHRLFLQRIHHNEFSPGSEHERYESKLPGTPKFYMRTAIPMGLMVGFTVGMLLTSHFTGAAAFMSIGSVWAVGGLACLALTQGWKTWAVIGAAAGLAALGVPGFAVLGTAATSALGAIGATVGQWSIFSTLGAAVAAWSTQRLWDHLATVRMRANTDNLIEHFSNDSNEAALKIVLMDRYVNGLYENTQHLKGKNFNWIADIPILNRLITPKVKEGISEKRVTGTDLFGDMDAYIHEHYNVGDHQGKMDNLNKMLRLIEDWRASSSGDPFVQQLYKTILEAQGTYSDTFNRMYHNEAATATPKLVAGPCISVKQKIGDTAEKILERQHFIADTVNNLTRKAVLFGPPAAQIGAAVLSRL